MPDRIPYDALYRQHCDATALIANLTGQISQLRDERDDLRRQLQETRESFDAVVRAAGPFLPPCPTPPDCPLCLKPTFDGRGDSVITRDGYTYHGTCHNIAIANCISPEDANRTLERARERVKAAQRAARPAVNL